MKIGSILIDLYELPYGIVFKTLFEHRIIGEENTCTKLIIDLVLDDMVNRSMIENKIIVVIQEYWALQ